MPPNLLLQKLIIYDPLRAAHGLKIVKYEKLLQDKIIHLFLSNYIMLSLKVLISHVCITAGHSDARLLC